MRASTDRRERLPGATCVLAAVVVGASLLSPAAALAQRAPAPLARVPAAARIPLPDLIAIKADTEYQLVAPSLFERRAVFRQVRGEWTILEAAFARDSTRGARLAGRAAALFVDGQSVGAARIRGIAPDFCGDLPAWCPAHVLLDIVGTLQRDTVPTILVSPPPTHTSDTDEPSEDEAAAGVAALLAVLRTAAGPNAALDMDQLSTQVFAIDDTDNERRIVVAAGAVGLSAGGSVSGVVVGMGADTLLRQAVGRAARRPAGQAGPAEELKIVTAMDFNGDGRDELLLGWVSAGEYTFEILTADRLLRFRTLYRGPDRSMPATAARRR